MSDIWFTSDTHFTHGNLMQYYPDRMACQTPENMTNHMVHLWNQMIKPKDVVYHLGDFGGKDVELDVKVARRLNGRLHYLPGNHDRQILRHRGFQERCSEIYPYSYAEISINKQKIVLCHYPIWEWNQIHRGWWHLHGHLHARSHGISGKIMDAGVDGNGLRPYHLDEVQAFMDERRIRTHHGKSLDFETESV